MRMLSTCFRADLHLDQLIVLAEILDHSPCRRRFAGVSQCRFAADSSWKTAASRYARSIRTREFAGIEPYKALAYWRSSVSYGPKHAADSRCERNAITVTSFTSGYPLSPRSLPSRSTPDVWLPKCARF